MTEKPVYIITFDSANNSLVLYSLLKDNRLKVYMIQTPCTLSAGCARSIEIRESDLSTVKLLIKDANIEIRNIHRKFVNEKTRRYEYEPISL